MWTILKRCRNLLSYQRTFLEIHRQCAPLYTSQAPLWCNISLMSPNPPTGNYLIPFQHNYISIWSSQGKKHAMPCQCMVSSLKHAYYMYNHQGLPYCNTRNLPTSTRLFFSLIAKFLFVEYFYVIVIKIQLKSIMLYA